MTVTVRAAVVEDLAAVLALYRQLYPELDLRAGTRVERAWQTTLATPDRTVLLAEVGGRPAGTADVTVLADVAHAGQPYLLVENVVVDAASRRRGVGRALLAAGMAASGRTYKRYLPQE